MVVLDPIVERAVAVEVDGVEVDGWVRLGEEDDGLDGFGHAKLGCS